MSKSTSILAAAAMSLSFAGLASAQVVFSDSFDGRTTGSVADTTNTTNFSSWGNNNNALGGTVTQTYGVTGGRTGGAQQTVENGVGVLRLGNAVITDNLATVAPNGYTVAFDFQRTGATGFTTMFFGLDPSIIPTTVNTAGAPVLFDTNTSTDGAVLFQQDNDNAGFGRTQGFAAGESVQQTAMAFADPLAVHSALVTVAAPDGFGAGQAGVVSYSVDGVPRGTFNLTFDGAFAGNVGFASNQVGNTIDNLVITALPIPEPASLALLGLGGLTLLRRRR